ncbi:uncharacterized protein ATNIH1004_002008 [Aspergillus tanneri]|uniref:Major facilitator superfamily (MFS) profile domain-containing protein n=1 Tax=Aspergillus tanneri TaxID=1220188 RepID=A0A5M9M780_9EURO|nr:uncharacterized protein ATNIH1004_002008 [Aspergillus tanneri]KAA8641340.1 hypothetical protein ATNIH1004_002008 [Aspergillus tanneri]
MAEQNRAPADSITVIHAIEVDAGPSQEISPNESPVEAHDLPEHLKFRTKLRLAAILVAIYLVLFVAAFDQTIIATSIPTISASLHSASGYTWIGGAYLLANTAAGPLWAKCSDIWGRKLALLSGVAIFAAASIIAAMSTSMAMLITARALQGTAAGGLGQMVTITISDVFKATMDIIVGILIRQTGRYKEIIWAGVIIMTMGTGLFISLQTDTPIASIIGFQIASGIGIAFLFQLPMIAVQNTVSQADTATATATLGFFRT